MGEEYDEARARLAGERHETERRLAGLTATFTGIVDAAETSNADDEHDPEGATIAFERRLRVPALRPQAISRSTTPRTNAAWPMCCMSSSITLTRRTARVTGGSHDRSTTSSYSSSRSPST